MTLFSPAAFRNSVVAALCAVGVAMPATADEFDKAERAQIEQIVRDYLLANPELMLEVQTALEQKQVAEEDERRKSIISASFDDLFRNPNDPVLGNPAGDVTIVEFFDYNCGFCRRAMDDMNAVIASDPNVRFVLKEFPILGEDSQDAHMVALAFNRMMPQHYAEFHERLMGIDGRVTGDAAIEVAVELGAEEETLRTEMTNPASISSIENTYMLAESLGITGTPSYVIGNQLVPGALGERALLEQVEQTRTCAETTC